VRINLSCPISGKRRDNNIARLVAGQVLIIAIVLRGLVAWPNRIGAAYQPGAVTNVIALILALALAVDFAIRGLWSPRYSPLALVGRGVSSGLKLKPKMTDAAPKIFAARIGLVMALTAAILIIAGLHTAAQIVLVILSVAAFLEAAFSFCLGCQVYSLLPRHIGNVLARDFAG